MSKFVRYLNDFFILELKGNEAKLVAELIKLLNDRYGYNSLLSEHQNFAHILSKLENAQLISPTNCNLLIECLGQMKLVDVADKLRENERKNVRASLSNGLNDEMNKFVDEVNGLKLDLNNNETYRVQINETVLNLRFKPHKFQMSLAKNGCNGVNNIVCVRTGSGKTLIAALICKYWTAKLSNFHAAFIVPTRHLANQQMVAFQMAGFRVLV